MPLIIINKRFDIRRRWNRNAVGFFRRNKDADRAVIGHQIFRRHGLHLFGRNLFKPIAIQKIQAPIAICDPFRE